MQNSIEVYSKVSSVADIERMGIIIAKSGFAGCDKVEAGQAIALICVSEGISLTTYLRTYDLIGGKPRKKAMAAAAEFRSKGGKIKWVATGDDGKKAVAELTFENQTVTVAYSIEDARKQGLIKGGSAWEKTPGNMLRARVLSNGIGMLAPEIFAGDDSDSEVSAPALNLAPTKTEIKTGSPESDFAPTVVPKVAPAPSQFPVAEAIQNAPGKVVDIPFSENTVEEKKFIATLKEGTTQLSVETVSKIMELLAGHEDEAMAWFVGKSWIKPGQPLDFISLKRAQLLVDAPQKFIAVLQGGAK